MDHDTAFEAIRISPGNGFVHETEGRVIPNGGRDIGFTMGSAGKDADPFEKTARHHSVLKGHGQRITHLREHAAGFPDCRCEGTSCASRRAHAVGRAHGPAPLQRLQALPRPRPALRVRVAGTVDQPCRPAGQRVQVPSPRPLDRLESRPRFDRLHLIGNNTRFLILAAPGVFPNLASHAFAAMTPVDGRRPAECPWSWPSRRGDVRGSVAVLRQHVQGGRRKVIHSGLSSLRIEGEYMRYTEPDGVPKELHVMPYAATPAAACATPIPFPKR